MVSLIVAHANQNVIGYKNQMPWHLPNDLKHVKNLTEGNTIVMGRKTLESLGKPLPNRKNVILTRNKNFNHPGVTVIHDLQSIHSLESDGKVFIFGGSNIYAQTMDIVNEMYITKIEESFGGDAFFPEYHMHEWDVIEERKGTVNDKNIFPHTFYHLVRK